MKIEIDRIHTPEGNLVFTITVKEPHDTWFGETENNIMKALDVCKEEVKNISPEYNKVGNEVIDLIFEAKEKTFLRILNGLKFSIENEFRPFFKPICQEIYNWIYDHQKDVVKSWMSDYDPQRTKYYFHNDLTNETNVVPQASEHENEEDEDEQE